MRSKDRNITAVLRDVKKLSSDYMLLLADSVSHAVKGGTGYDDEILYTIVPVNTDFSTLEAVVTRRIRAGYLPLSFLNPHGKIVLERSWVHEDVRTVYEALAVLESRFVLAVKWKEEPSADWFLQPVSETDRPTSSIQGRRKSQGTNENENTRRTGSYFTHAFR